VWDWLAALQDGRAAPPRQSLEIDYRRYAAGEASLAWLDQRIRLVVPQGQGRMVIVTALERLAAALSARKAGIGHLKLILQAPDVHEKISLTTLEEPGWQDKIPAITGESLSLLINARVELPVEDLTRLMHQAFDQSGVKLIWEEGDAFHPKEPNPTHRFA
jgi:hypothetical protein